MSFSLNDRKTRFQILILSLLLLGAGYYFWYYQPSVTTLEQAKGRYHQLEQEVIFGRKRAAELRDYAQRVTELKVQVAQVESRLLGGNRILLFLQALEESSRKSGVSLVTLEPLPVKDQGEVIQQPVEVAFTGPLARTYSFIDSIENLAYPSEIQQANFRLVEEDGEAILRAELVIVMHSLKGGEV